MSLGWLDPPELLRKGLKFARCLCIVVVTENHTDTFWKGGIFCCGRGHLRGKFSMGREVFGVSFPGKILRWENLIEFLYEILFICLAFFLPTQFRMWRCPRRIVRRKFSAELKLSGGFSKRGGAFSTKIILPGEILHREFSPGETFHRWGGGGPRKNVHGKGDFWYDLKND